MKKLLSNNQDNTEEINNQNEDKNNKEFENLLKENDKKINNEEKNKKVSEDLKNNSTFNIMKKMLANNNIDKTNKDIRNKSEIN